MDQSIAEIVDDGEYFNFYITSGGRIWGVKNAELINGEAQERRNLLGNSFNTIEEACYAKSQIEAWARLKQYAEIKEFIRNGNHVIELEFHLPAYDKEVFDGDIMLIANKYKLRERTYT